MVAAPRVLFVSPGWPKGRLWGEMSFRFPSLSLAVVAAATPPHWETALCDEGFGAGRPRRPTADVVAITAMTAQAVRAYEIADAFRSRGKTVVMGGFHASNLPDEALGHVDAVVVGEAEAVWPRLLADFEEGRLQKVYRADALVDTAAIPVARRSIFDGKGYLLTNTVQTTRGCPYDCEFCSVTAFFGRKYRKRPVEAVLAELAADAEAGLVRLLRRRQHRRRPDLLPEALPRDEGDRAKWLSHASLDLAEDPELLDGGGEVGLHRALRRLRDARRGRAPDDGEEDEPGRGLRRRARRRSATTASASSARSSSAGTATARTSSRRSSGSARRRTSRRGSSRS